MRIAESCTESVHVVHASNMCAAWRCRLDTSGIDLSQVEGARQACDRAGVPSSARAAPSEEFSAVAVAEVGPPKEVAASHGAKRRRSRYQLTVFIAQRLAYRVGEGRSRRVDAIGIVYGGDRVGVTESCHPMSKSGEHRKNDVAEAVVPSTRP